MEITEELIKKKSEEYTSLFEIDNYENIINEQFAFQAGARWMQNEFNKNREFKWIENLIPGDLVHVDIIGIDGSVTVINSFFTVSGNLPHLRCIAGYSNETGYFHKVPYEHVKPCYHG